MVSTISTSLPCENPLLVASNPLHLLLGHEIGKVPHHLPDEPALRLRIVKSSEVFAHEVVLELLGEGNRGKAVKAGHCVRSVLGHLGGLDVSCEALGLAHQDGLVAGLPPVAQVVQHLSVDELQVSMVPIPVYLVETT